MKRNSNIDDIIKRLRLEMPRIEEKYRIQSLGVFGSYVRQENRTGSDLDLLVHFDEVPSLLKFLELENYLSDALGIKVDLVMASALKPRIGERVLKELVPV